jgi:hypothetical protein
VLSDVPNSSRAKRRKLKQTLKESDSEKINRQANELPADFGTAGREIGQMGQLFCGEVPL